jgi:crotonobetainyl-CoA:carnitine CoA-transferase CaiB-like acyl-CoA transferase
VRYDGAAAEVALAPQPLGAQSAAILAELGYAEDAIVDLERRGIVRCGEG